MMFQISSNSEFHIVSHTNHHLCYVCCRVRQALLVQLGHLAFQGSWVSPVHLVPQAPLVHPVNPLLNQSKWPVSMCMACQAPWVPWAHQVL